MTALPAFRHVAILGPGLLGGSLALAVRARLPGCRVTVWARREAAVEAVQAEGMADFVSTDPVSVVTGADLVIFCVPVGAMEELARQIAQHLDPQAVITDVGSVKASVVETLTPIFATAQRGVFIGSHPMAGSEQTGLAAAEADLFENAVCILTPEENAVDFVDLVVNPPVTADSRGVAQLDSSLSLRAERSNLRDQRGCRVATLLAMTKISNDTATDSQAATAQTLERLEQFWRALGCRVRRLSPAEHDRTVGLVSHLPHLLAAALVDFIHAENPAAAGFCGNGLRDTTRVASGPPEMWSEILTHNRQHVAQQLENFAQSLQKTAKLLANGDRESLQTLLAQAKTQRDGMR